MAPRFIDSKTQRVKTGILAAKGGRNNFRKKRERVRVVSFAASPRSTCVIGPESARVSAFTTGKSARTSPSPSTTSEDPLLALPPVRKSTVSDDYAHSTTSNPNSGGKFIGEEILLEHVHGHEDKDDHAESDRAPQQQQQQTAKLAINSNSNSSHTHSFCLSRADRQNRCLAFDTRSLVLIRSSTTSNTSSNTNNNTTSSNTTNSNTTNNNTTNNNTNNTYISNHSPSRSGLSISNDMNQFVEHLAVRGYTSPVLAWTISNPTKRGKISSVDATSGATRQLSYTSGVGIRTMTSSNHHHNGHQQHQPINDVTIQSSNASWEQGKWKLSEIPNTLTADFTWNLMADLGTNDCICSNTKLSNGFLLLLPAHTLSFV